MGRSARTRPRRPLLLTLCLIPLLLLTGCTKEEPLIDPNGIDLDTQLTQLRDEGYTEQADILADGDISSDEYWDAFYLMSDCVSQRGGAAELEDPAINPIDGLTILFGIVQDRDSAPAKPGQGPMAECRTRYFTTVEIWYQITHTYRMAPVLMEKVRACLNDQGFETTGQELNYRDLAGPSTSASSPRELATMTCTTDETRALYPSLHFISFGG